MIRYDLEVMPTMKWEDRERILSRLDRLDSSFGNWFAGFTDGEGCFTIERKKERFACKFSIEIREDDLSILQEIRKALNVGSLYRRERYRGNPQSTLIVFKKIDVAFLVYFFDRYRLRAKKRIDYGIWREAVVIHSESNKGTIRTSLYKPLMARLTALKKELEESREYKPIGVPISAYHT